MRKLIRASAAWAVVVLVGAGCNCGGPGSGPCVPEPLTTASVAGGKVLPPFSCWTVAGDVNVSDGTLSAGEGVTITFASTAGLRVTGQGRFSAVGTAAAPVVLQGQEDRRGAWKGVSIGTDSADNRLEHVLLTGAGNDAWTGNNDTKAALFVDDPGRVALVSLRLVKSGWYGLFTEGVDSTLATFSGVRFEDNERVARLHANTAGGVGADTAFEGNGESVVRLAYGGSDQVRTAATWRNLAVPWLVTGRVSLYATVTVEPGTTLRFAEGAGLHARNDAGNVGALDATGTAAAPITFTGAEALAGTWLGLGFDTDTASNRLAHASVQYAGRQGWNGNALSKAALFVASGARLALDTVSIGHSDGYGLHLVTTSSQATCSGVTFEATNASGAVTVGNMTMAACP